MNAEFAKRVRSAAVAGWWTILIGSLFLALQWLASQTLLSTKPQWLLTLWGPDIPWETRAARLVVDHGDLQDVSMVDGARGHMAVALGPAATANPRLITWQ